MSLVGKIFAVLSLVLAVFYAGITSALLSVQENYKQQLASKITEYDKKLEDKDNELKSRKNMYDQLQGEHTILQRDYARLLGENRELSNEWAEAAAVNLYSKNIIDDQEAYIGRLENQWNVAKQELLDKVKAVDNRDETIKGLNTRIAALVADKDSLADFLKQRDFALKNAETELRKVVNDNTYNTGLLVTLKEQRPDIYHDLITNKLAGGGGAIQPREVIRGKVVAVNKQAHIVILNVGQRHGVQKGYSFVVFRGSEYVGRVIVDDVSSPDQSAARYDAKWMKSDPEVGDDVTTKLAAEF
jgi:hypothetical protein